MNKYAELEKLHDIYKRHNERGIICSCGKILPSTSKIYELFIEVDDVIYETNPWLIKAAFGFWAMQRSYKIIENFIIQTKLFNKEKLNNLMHQAKFEEFFNNEHRVIFYTLVEGNVYASILNIDVTFAIPRGYKEYETGASAIIKYSKKEEI